MGEDGNATLGEETLTPREVQGHLLREVVGQPRHVGAIDEDPVSPVDRRIVDNPFDGREPIIERERFNEPQPDDPGPMVDRP
jgi:hypothetical protein